VHLQELSERLAARGHDVTVLTANVTSSWNLSAYRYGDLPDAEIINGVKVARFRPDGGRVGAGVARWLALRGGQRSLELLLTREGVELVRQGPRSAFSIIPRILRSQADIVATINWFWPVAYYAYLARRIRSFPLVGIPLFHPAETWAHRGIYKRLLSQCNAVVANTGFEADFARQRGARRVEVAGVGIEPRSFTRRDGAAIRARYLLGDRPVVGFVGRQTPNKGVDVLLDAMRKVWQWSPDVRLVLAGSRPDPSSQVEALFEGLSQPERDRIVRIHDFPDEEKASIYDAFDLLALPSIGESFGIAYLESWACGKPVIGARIGPVECVIDDAVDGFLVDPNDAAGLAARIMELLSDRDKRDRMGRSGQAKTLAQFTWDQVTDKVERLYRELVAIRT
jgi:glycosyltransferase involved in cell wall biosynthesis